MTLRPQISIKLGFSGKFSKMVHPDFFGEDGGKNSHHSDLYRKSVIYR